MRSVLVLFTLSLLLTVSCDVILTPFPAASQSNEQFSGAITLTSASIAHITGLTFAGVAPDTWIVAYNGTLTAGAAQNAIKLQLGTATSTTCTSKLGILTAPGIEATLELPIGYTWSQFTTIGAWCFTANALFGSTSIPTSSSTLPATALKARVCPAILPLSPFPVASQANEQFSGAITLTSTTTARIVGLTFAGVAPDTFIVAYTDTLTAGTAANAIKLQLGTATNTTCTSKLGVLAAPGIDATLELPVGYTWSQFTTIGAWCFTANALFASTNIPTSSSMLSTTLSTPRICPVTLPLTPFPAASQANEQTSGSIILTSSTTARVTGLTFAGVAPDSFLVAYTDTITAGNKASAVKLSIWFIDADKTMIQSNCNNKLGVLAAPGKEAVLEIPVGYTWSQFNKIGVWCFTANVLFASTNIPTTATDLPRATIGTQLCPASLALTPFPVASQSNEQFSGSITLLSSTTARINAFTFAGVAPDTYLVAYNGTLAAGNEDMALKLQIWFDRTTSTTTCNNKLGVYAAPGKDGFIELPVGYTWSQFTMIGAWCFTANVLFGSTSIPASSADLPRALTGSTACPSSTPSILIGNLGPGEALAHGLQGKIYATSTTTLRVEGFSFDGLAPDSYFIAGRLPVGVTTISAQYAMKIVATDNCVQAPLTKYDNSVINLELPAGMTIADIGFIAVWCFQARALFGSVMVTPTLSTSIINQLGSSYVTPTCTGIVAGIYENCEPLDSEYQVSWTVERAAGTIAFQLQAITPAQVRAAAMRGVITPFWMGFGLSGSQTGAQMIGSDVTVASYDIQGGHVMAIDFSPQSKSQCSTTGGVCSDVHAGGTNDVTSASGTYDSTAPQGLSLGVTTVRYRRPIIPTDITLQINATVGVVTALDQSFALDTLQYVVWAMGPLNIDKNPLYHYRHIPNGAGTTPLRINFGRPATNNCPVLGSSIAPSMSSSTGTTPVTDCSPRGPWTRPYIMNQTTIVARIGPVGGQAKGYAPITGQPSWGISWYLNDILIPILAVERGKTYTFMVHGGSDPENNAGYHPFYITNSSYGGLAQASATDAPEKVYAGGLTSAPIGTGTACDIEETTASTTSYTVATFQQYKQTLKFSNTCDNTSPDAIKNALVWTVPMDAPDTLYYQCLLHRNLGWRIRVYNAGAMNEAELQALSTPTGAALPAACSVTSSSTGTMTTSTSHAIQTTVQFVYIVLLLSLCAIMFL